MIQISDMITINKGSGLSEREVEVLELIAMEYNSREIAQQLYISYHTAISHRQNLLIKLDVRNTAGAVRRGFELGLLTIA